MRLTVCLGLLALLLPGPVHGAAGQASGTSSGGDDFRALAALSFRAWVQISISYQVTATTPERAYCLQMSITAEGTRGQTLAERASFACDASYSGLPPRELWFGVHRSNHLQTLLNRLDGSAAVTEGEGRTVMGLDTRCFELSVAAGSANVCVSPASGAVLHLEAREGESRLSMTATSVYSAVERDNPDPRDLTTLLALIARGLTSTYTTDFDVGSGGRLVAARSGARDRLAFEGGADVPGTLVDIDDGERVFRCESRPEAAPHCAEQTRYRIGPPGWHHPTRLSGLERQILADPGAWAVESEGRTVAGREARCFRLSAYPPPTGLPIGVGATVRSQETVCLDAAQGALLLRQSGSEPPTLVATRHVASAEAALFVPPYPPGLHERSR